MIRLWDLENDHHLIRSGHAESVAIAPTGSETVVGHTNGTIEVLPKDLSGPGEVLLEHARGAMDAVAFSPDGDLLASGSSDRSIHIWGRRGNLPFKQILQGHRGRVQSIAFIPQHHLLASASFDSTVKLWDLKRESIPRWAIDCVKDPITDHQHATAIASDLQYVAYRLTADRVEVVDIDGNRLPITDATTGAVGTSVAESVALGLDFLSSDQPVLFGIPNPDGIVSSWHVKEEAFSEATPKFPVRLVARRHFFQQWSTHYFDESDDCDDFGYTNRRGVVSTRNARQIFRSDCRSLAVRRVLSRWGTLAISAPGCARLSVG